MAFLTLSSPGLSVSATERVRNHGLRVVGDVHGELEVFEHALHTERYIIQLGDLVDYGPKSAEVLKRVIRLQEAERGMFVIGNHDRKLGRLLAGRRVKKDAVLEETCRQIKAFGDEHFEKQIFTLLNKTPAWQRIGDWVFCHGGFHTEMLQIAPPPTSLEEISPPLSRALFGETVKGSQPDGYPERRLTWVHRIPEGITVFIGHDCRSLNGLPWERTGRQGGKAIFMDLGAGKGGHLAWLDLNLPESLENLP